MKTEDDIQGFAIGIDWVLYWVANKTEFVILHSGEGLDIPRHTGIEYGGSCVLPATG
jgi:hypothetical protein